MKIKDQVQHFFKNHFSENDHFILGLSGGLDSTVLAEILYELGISFSAAHVNYQLRGEDSMEDERSVKNWCDSHQINFQLLRVQKDKSEGNTQNWARKIRRSFFEDCLKKQNAKAIILAQHSDDNWETQWLHFLRGSIQGLGGMKEINGRYVRPLLKCSKKEIDTWASSKKINWREDASNQLTDYNRNFLRLEILPRIQDRFEIDTRQINERSELLHHFMGWNHYLMENWIQENVQSKDNLAQLIFSSIPQHLHVEIILHHWLHEFHLSKNEIEEIGKLMHASIGAFREYELFSIQKTAIGLALVRKNIVYPSAVTIEENTSLFQWNQESYSASLTMMTPDFKIEKNPNVMQFDADLISFPIILRSYQPGDKIQPLGMKGKMLISDYLTQKKIPSLQKSTIAVIENNNQIIGILGFTISETHKITKDSRRVFTIHHLQHP